MTQGNEEDMNRQEERAEEEEDDEPPLVSKNQKKGKATPSKQTKLSKACTYMLEEIWIDGLPMYVSV